MSHFNVSLIVWAKSQDSVHKPQFLKRKESRSGSNQGPSAYQPSALPLGHTGSLGPLCRLLRFILHPPDVMGLLKPEASQRQMCIRDRKRKESRSGSNQGPSAYQPSALPLGHTGSLEYGRTGTLSQGSHFRADSLIHTGP